VRSAWVLHGLARHRVRTTLVVLGISVAAALLLDMVMLRGGMERSFERMLLSRGYQIRISPKGTLPFDTEASIPSAGAIVARLRSDPAIEAAGAVVGAAVLARTPDSTVSVVGYGIDPEAQAFYRLVAGAELAVGDSSGAVVGEPAARAFGWGVGDTIELESRLDPGALRPSFRRSLVIRGVVEWLYDAPGQRSIGTLVPVMQAFGGIRDLDGASALLVKVIDGADPDSVAARLAAELPSVEVNSVAGLVRHFRARLVYFRQLAVILATIAFVVALLLVGTILTISVNERLGEIAVLRAIGVVRHKIAGAVMLEGLGLALLGSGLGTGLGLATARYLDAILKAFPGLPAAISFFVAEPSSVARAALGVLVAGALAGGYPAWIAANAPIAATLREEAE